MGIELVSGSDLGCSRLLDPALDGSRNWPSGEAVSTENLRGDWVCATEEKPTAVNGTFRDAVETGLLANSDASGGGNSALPAERGPEGFFLRAGRIHGGRVELVMSSWEMVWLSSGICVTTKVIRSCDVTSTRGHTPAKFLHHITGALATYVTTTESPQKAYTRSQAIERGSD